MQARSLFPFDKDYECMEPPCRELATRLHHKDRDRTNNVRRNIERLCDPCHKRLHWDDPEYRQAITGENNGSSKLTESEVTEIRRRYAAGGVTKTKLGLEYGVSRTTIRYLVNRRTWAHLG